MAVDVSIDVGARLGAATSIIGDAARDAVRDRLRRIALELREYLLDVWPVLTAASLQEWEIRASGMWLIVRNPLDYAEYVHRAGETVEVWTEIRDRADELVDAALPELRDLVASMPSLPLASPVIQPRGTDLTTLLYDAKRRAIQAVNMLERDRIRARLSPEGRRPRLQTLGPVLPNRRRRARRG